MLKNIAYECSYESIPNFYNDFKKIFNYTPLEFRRINMKDIKIRKATIEDAKAIVDILKDTAWFEFINNESHDKSESRTKNYITACLNNR